jgi:hypothetical protein
MSPLLATRVLLALTALTAFVGLVDGIRGGDQDLALLFGLVLVLVAVHTATLEGRRAVVSVRGDLFRWLRRRAALTGEPVTAITDRALATYRRSLTGDEPRADRPAEAVADRSEAPEPEPAPSRGGDPG